MKITNGKIIISIGIIHTLLTLTPFVYGPQFKCFAVRYFFAVNKGFLETGPLNYETFAAFWCFCFGIFLFPLGVLVDHIEKNGLSIPWIFLWTYLIVILIAVYMIPFGGFTVFMLPHAVYMFYRTRRKITG